MPPEQTSQQGTAETTAPSAPPPRSRRLLVALLIAAAMLGAAGIIYVLTRATAPQAPTGANSKFDVAPGDKVDYNPTASQLPTDFPADFPIPDGAKLYSTFRDSGASFRKFTIGWTSGSDQATVVGFYRQALSRSGWNPTYMDNQDGSSSYLISRETSGEKQDGTIDIGPNAQEVTEIDLNLTITRTGS